MYAYSLCLAQSFFINDRSAAPTCLRELRLQAFHARRDLCELLRTEAPREMITAAKRRWNFLTARCRSTSKTVKAKQCVNSRTMWERLRSSAPRQLCATFRHYTNQSTVAPQCSPDQQWNHWATQGDVRESVWNDSVHSIADTWVNEVLRAPTTLLHAPVSEAEAEAARKRLRHGRTPGIDGIANDVVRKLDCLIPLMSLLFSVMLRFAVYPNTLGLAIIKSLLKPGKPKDQPSSMRGIRLLSCFTTWFGQVSD